MNSERTIPKQPATANGLVSTGWLELLEAKRQSILIELEETEKVLIRYGRLRYHSLPARERMK